jgi:hypothetical protein
MNTPTVLAKLNINLPFGTYSINEAHYAGFRGVRKEAQNWYTQVFHELSKIQPQIAEFKQTFNPDLHVLHIEATAFYPADLYFTKAGDISSRIHDITNWEKMLQDALCDEKNVAKYAYSKCENLAINDKFVKRFVSQSLPADSHSIQILVQLVKRPINPLARP